MYTARELYNSPPIPSFGSTSLAQQTRAPGDDDPAWHPNNPLFWFGGLLLVTFGLIGATSSLRVGPVRASVKAGKD